MDTMSAPSPMAASPGYFVDDRASIVLPYFLPSLPVGYQKDSLAPCKQTAPEVCLLGTSVETGGMIDTC